MTQLEWQQLEEIVLRLSAAEKERLRVLLNRSARTDREAADPLPGLMVDEPEIVDTIVQSAMLARQRGPLRIRAFDFSILQDTRRMHLV
jgi:hypothetical protein